MALTDNEIDKIFVSMPGGPTGFCVDWGYLQFARKVLEAADSKRTVSSESHIGAVEPTNLTTGLQHE